MAKLAVIIFLFALCAVAMSARIAREEPTKKQFDQIQGGIKRTETNYWVMSQGKRSRLLQNNGKEID